MKVRHYKSYYRKTNNSLKTIALILAVVLVIAGFLLIKFLMSKQDSNDVDTSSQTSSEVVSNTSSEITPVRTSTVRAVFLTSDVASDVTKLAQFIETAKENNITDVIITVKDEVGYLYYDTAYTPAANIKNRSDQMYDVSLAVTALHNNGLKAVAHMHCFSDRIGTRIKNAGVLYSENHSVVWLDDDKENGGKSWLNPYSDEAVAYLNYIANELVAMKFDTILLDSVRFPGGYQNYAYYGENLSTKKACLSGFVSEMKQKLKENNVDLWLYASAQSYVDPVLEIYPDNVFSLGADTVLIDTMPNNFPSRLAFGQVQIDKPIQNPEQTVLALVTHAQETAAKSGKIRIIPVLQGYTDPTITADYNLTYTQTELQKQFLALDKTAISDYVVYTKNSELDILQ